MQTTPPLDVNDNDAATPLVQQMTGTWDVRQRMWPGVVAKAIDLPPALAHRVLIGNAILQEVMTLASESGETPFTRVAYFDYNVVNQQYQYFSLDTRAPQMMNERSLAATPQGKSQHRDTAGKPLDPTDHFPVPNADVSTKNVRMRSAVRSVPSSSLRI